MAATLAALSFLPAAVAPAQTCTWGGTSLVAPPSTTPLRAHRNFFRSPARVAVDPSGKAYTTDPGTGQVFVRDRYGRLRAVIDGFDSPLGIAVDAGGRIHVGEEGKGRVTVFDQLWNPLYRLGRGDGEFLTPNEIAVDPDPGYRWIYVSDSAAHAIKVYSPDGAFLSSFGEKGTAPGQLDFPASVHVSATGEVFVADQSNDRVQVFDRTGRFLRCFGSRGSSSFSTRFGRIQGLTGDSGGRLYVADSFQGYVQVFDRFGAPLATIGTFGEGPGQLRTPVGLAIDQYNRLFVASANTARVEVFGLDRFSDPQVIPAVVDVRPNTVNRSTTSRWFTAYIEIRGYPLDRVNVATITANGVSARPSPLAIADHDQDRIPDLMVKFNADALLATLPDGEAIIVVSGEFTDGTAFEGADKIRVIPSRGGR
jgi:DNA-binding beta-propeller fold protein YncE